MLAEWAAECGADDPVLVVPWSDPDDPEGNRFIDLRENPYDLDLIPEAEHHPALLRALRVLNGTRSPVFTAKCDVWTIEMEDVRALAAELLQPETDLRAGFGSYLDLVWRERTLFVSLHHQQQRLDRLVRLLDPLPEPLAAVELVLRPAVVDFSGAREGFAVTLYVKALGTDSTAAYEAWSHALGSAIGVIRNKDLPFSP